jgi:nicotinate-nucleotide adenylyltransferase
LHPHPVGLFGGTFDPVHFGHLRAAFEAMEMLGVGDFRLLPAGRPPHRASTFASAGHRLAMLKLAVSGQRGFSVDDREIRREGLSWMVDTLAEIRKEEGDSPLLLLIGQDAANALDSWHEWRRLFELTHFVVMRRPETGSRYSDTLREHMQRRRTENPGKLKLKPAGMVLHLEVTQLDISSTAIRGLLAKGRSPEFLMPDSVIEYIRDNRLYGSFAAVDDKG